MPSRNPKRSPKSHKPDQLLLEIANDLRIAVAALKEAESKLLSYGRVHPAEKGKSPKKSSRFKGPDTRVRRDHANRVSGNRR